MGFTSVAFLGFLALTLLVYYLIPQRFRWAVLLAASYAFYLLNGVKQVVFLIFTTVVTYAAGRMMQRIRDGYRTNTENEGQPLTREEKQAQKKELNGKIRTVKVAALLIDLGLLIALKYVPFLVRAFGRAFASGDSAGPGFSLLVPLGLSYYTFQSVGYLIDVGKGKYGAEKHIGRFALFVSFFPSIIQGPINNFGDLGFQLREPHPLEYKNLKSGAQRILWGFFKKLVIADRIAPLVQSVFALPGYDPGRSGLMFLIGVVSYGIQIYGDFSGGIDIALGAAEMFGIRLPENFQRPYFSQSLAEFWRRWHITLGAWMREYVFFPVILSRPVNRIAKVFRNRFGKKAGKLLPSVVTTFLVFFLIGIWHGISWQNIMFALYNAVIVAGGVALADVFRKLAARFRNYENGSGWKLFRIFRTLIIINASRVFAKAPSGSAAIVIWKRIFTGWERSALAKTFGEIFSLGVCKRDALVLAIALLILFAVSLLQEKGVRIRERIDGWPAAARWAFWLLTIAVILVFGVYGPAYDAKAFIYQGF